MGRCVSHGKDTVVPSVEDVLTAHQQQLCEAFASAGAGVGSHYAAMPREQLRAAAFATGGAFVRAVVERDPEIARRRWHTVAYERAAQGFPVEEIQAAATLLRAQTYALLARIYVDDPAGELAAIKTVEAYFHASRLAIAEGFEQYHHSAQSKLEHAMSELAAPIVPIYDGLLVMPLVGSIDSQRATVIMETLLDAVNRRNAEVVLLDITGVPVVDTGVANYLIQATRAVRLLGADIVLAGIGPTIAQTIVELGVDLSSIVTRADLSAALDYALRRRGLAIGPVDHSGNGAVRPVRRLVPA